MVIAVRDAELRDVPALLALMRELTREYLFIDDLYVAAAQRGKGTGKLLMQRIAAMALARDVDARWHVETVNRAAQEFYKSLGAELRDRYIAYWSREAMRSFRP